MGGVSKSLLKATLHFFSRRVRSKTYLSLGAEGGAYAGNLRLQAFALKFEQTCVCAKLVVINQYILSNTLNW